MEGGGVGWGGEEAGLGSWRLASDSKGVEDYFPDKGTVVDGLAAVNERVYPCIGMAAGCTLQVQVQ